MQEWSPYLNRMLSTMETRENRENHENREKHKPSLSYKATFLYYWGCLKLEKSSSTEDIIRVPSSDYVDNPIKSHYRNMNN